MKEWGFEREGQRQAYRCNYREIYNIPINRELADLFVKEMTANGKIAVEKRYYADGKLAAKAYNRCPRKELYWPGPETAGGRLRVWRIEGELTSRIRDRLSTAEYEQLRELPGWQQRRSARALKSPSNSESGTGGWLEYTEDNLRIIRETFNPLMSPLGLTADDLLVLSSTMTTQNPDYRELPPEDLWPNMQQTLGFLAHLFSSSGVTFTILSAYRSDTVNALSGGASGSAHMDFSGLDVAPSDPGRFEAFVKHSWHARGRSYDFGLGFYRPGRVHVDTRRYRRWEWNNESAGTSRTRYESVFGTTPLPT